MDTTIKEDGQNKYGYKIFIWIILALFFIIQYVLRVLPNEFTLFFIENFKISSNKLGQIFGLYYIGYAVLHIIFGFLADKGYIKNIVIISLLGILLSLTISIYFYDNWLMSLVARFILGGCSAAAITSVIKISVLYFKNFSFVISFTAFLGIVSSGYISELLFNYYNQTNWESMNIAIICLIAILFIISAIFIPNKDKLIDSQSNISQDSIFISLIKLFKNKDFIRLCIVGALMAGTIEGFADAWSSSFFATVYKNIVTPSEIAYLTPIIFTSFAIGTLSISIIGDITKKYYPMLIIANLSMMSSFSIILSGLLTSNIGLIIACIILGFSSGYQIIIMTLGIKKTVKEMAAFSGSVLNTIIMLGGYLFHSAIGYIFNSTNTTSSFQYALSIIPIGLAIALILVVYLYISDKKLIK
ncbi:MAG: MFS transporter [Anaplasmataceae bacterium]|nr:MFS transporter [Anaplasmataceae bacterium]